MSLVRRDETRLSGCPDVARGLGNGHVEPFGNGPLNAPTVAPSVVAGFGRNLDALGVQGSPRPTAGDLRMLNLDPNGCQGVQPISCCLIIQPWARSQERKRGAQRRQTKNGDQVPAEPSSGNSADLVNPVTRCRET